ncbi:MAG: DUF433 domain-containing protein [Thioploca sp.]|nr:DUF433 domain-containing protein [Thioploca sp.]
MIMKLIGRITIDSHICYGKPCVRQLRCPVENILELLSASMSIVEIVADEDLEKENILAVFAYATQLTQIKKIQIVAPRNS